MFQSYLMKIEVCLKSDIHENDIHLKNSSLWRNYLPTSQLILSKQYSLKQQKYQKFWCGRYIPFLSAECLTWKYYSDYFVSIETAGEWAWKWGWRWEEQEACCWREPASSAGKQLVSCFQPWFSSGGLYCLV